MKLNIKKCYKKSFEYFKKIDIYFITVYKFNGKFSISILKKYMVWFGNA